MAILRTMMCVSAAMWMLAATGCQTSETGATNTFGTVKATLRAEPDVVAHAAVRAMEALDLRVAANRSDKLQGHVVAYTTDDTKATVDVHTVSRGASEVGVRVGTFGDSDASLTILNKIKQQLRRGSPAIKQPAAKSQLGPEGGTDKRSPRSLSVSHHH